MGSVRNAELEVRLMKNLVMRLWREEEAQDLTEYGLLLVLISLVAIASMTTMGSAISNVFVTATTNLATGTT